VTRRFARGDVTVVVPTKDEEANIGRFLDSVPDEVHLIVVDSSSDSTPSLVDQSRSGALTVIRTHADIPTARQIGSDAANTPWVLFTDADVVFAPDYFDRLGDLTRSACDGGIVGVKATAGGHDTYHRWFVRAQATLGAVGIPAATGSNMLVSRKALRTIGGFDPRLQVNEDTELMFRIKRAGFRVRFERRLEVRAFDHRRLEAGVARKILHGAVRNSLLYLGLFDRQVRAGDWGYWAPTDGAMVRPSDRW
jgi:glycosyltransferase involved in cell wall biosynthesis